MIKKILNKMPSSVRKRIISDLQEELKTEYRYTLRKEETKLLSDKIIIVTGATGAIGFATALKLGCEGAIVGVAGRSEEKVKDTITKLLAINPEMRLEPLIINVLNDAQIKQAIDDFAKKHYNRIDGLVNNAGGSERKRKAVLWDLPVEVIDEVLNTNLRGSMICSKYVLPYMINHKSGKIVNLSSVMGINGKEKMTSYSASKSGIIGFTKALALEAGPYGICVNSIAPGMIFQHQLDRLPEGDRPTETNALKRYGYTDEAAALIAFLLSDQANYITGQNIAVDGGRSIGLKDNINKSLKQEIIENIIVKK